MTFGTLPRLHFMQRGHAVPRLFETCRDIGLALVHTFDICADSDKVPNRYTTSNLQNRALRPNVSVSKHMQAPHPQDGSSGPQRPQAQRTVVFWVLRSAPSSYRISVLWPQSPQAFQSHVVRRIFARIVCGRNLHLFLQPPHKYPNGCFLCHVTSAATAAAPPSTYLPPDKC